MTNTERLYKIDRMIHSRGHVGFPALLGRIHQLLGDSQTDARALMKRVKIVTPARRPVPGKLFETVGEAVTKRRCLQMTYLTRSRGELGQREASPQRLVHYRHTWYLDAWCHRVDELRRFALDAIEQASVLDTRAKDVAMKTVEETMDTGYGIYAGKKRHWATLVFQPHAAQWVSREEWHPQQQGRWLEDGRYEVLLPYADQTEVVMDVLRHGDQVRVVGPEALARAVKERLAAASAQYR